MDYVEFRPGKFLTRETYDRLVEKARDIRIEDCVEITDFSDEALIALFTSTAKPGEA